MASKIEMAKAVNELKREIKSLEQSQIVIICVILHANLNIPEQTRKNLVEVLRVLGEK